MAMNVKKKNVPQGFHKNNLHKNIVHKNNIHKNKNMNVTFDGIKNKEVFINEDEESESSSKKR